MAIMSDRCLIKIWLFDIQVHQLFLTVFVILQPILLDVFGDVFEKI